MWTLLVQALGHVLCANLRRVSNKTGSFNALSSGLQRGYEIPTCGTQPHHDHRCKSTDAEQTYKLLTGVVVPRPIAWITTRSATGVVNVAPFSAFTFVSNKPPLLGVNIGRKAGLRKDTAHHIMATGEFVVHIANSALTPEVHASAVEHPPDVSEVDLLGLRTLPSQHLAVPRLQAAPVAMECRLPSCSR